MKTLHRLFGIIFAGMFASIVASGCCHCPSKSASTGSGTYSQTGSGTLQTGSGTLQMGSGTVQVGSGTLALAPAGSVTVTNAGQIVITNAGTIILK